VQKKRRRPEAGVASDANLSAAPSPGHEHVTMMVMTQCVNTPKHHSLCTNVMLWVKHGSRFTDRRMQSHALVESILRCASRFPIDSSISQNAREF
jgi:hypothetical protein